MNNFWRKINAHHIYFMNFLYQIMQKAVYNSMKGTLQRRYTMQRLHIFADDKIPEDILGNITNQLKQVRQVPTRLDHIDEDVVKNFPKIMDYPKDYVLK